jgi:hypothetical protein
MTTTKPQVKIVNCETGEEVVRDANAKELAQMKSDANNFIAAQAEAETQARVKADLLSRLGLTADEAKLLLG